MKQSAGLLVYRRQGGKVEVLIAHPGGPYFAKKEEGVWSIPKGMVDKGEKPLEAAKREFEEELGIPAPDERYRELGEAKYPKGGKSVAAWAVEADVDLSSVDEAKVAKVSIEWPPRSGRNHEFPEVDRPGWYGLEEAAVKLFPPQVVFLVRLAELLGVKFEPINTEGNQLGLL